MSDPVPVPRPSEPLPCPFCQSEARIHVHHDYWQVECWSDGCQTAGPVSTDSEADAIAKWNARGSVADGYEQVILHWRSALLGILGEPEKSSIPEWDHALNQLTLAIVAREADKCTAAVRQWAERCKTVEAELARRSPSVPEATQEQRDAEKRPCPQYVEAHGYCTLTAGHDGDCTLETESDTPDDAVLMEAIELTIEAIDAQHDIPRQAQVVDYAEIIKQARRKSRTT